MLILRITWRLCRAPSTSVSQPAPQVGLLILSICSESKTSWFAPSLPTSLCISAQKQTLRPPAGWRDGPWSPHGSAHPRRAGSAKWTRQSSLRAASVSLNHLPGKRERAEFAAGAWRKDERGCGRESPCLQGGQGWMRVTTGMEAFAKSWLQLTTWPVEGQAGKEIEVNNVVTY